MAQSVRITEVAPRDGLQNESGVIPTDDKAALVRACTLAGVDEVEVSSFVSPRWIPQLGDAAEVFDATARWLATDAPPEARRVLLSALVPNERGMQALLDVNRRAREEHGVDRLIGKASVFTAASETFSRKNTNASIAETIERFRPVFGLAREHGLAVRGYVSCVIACPFEGPIAPEAVADVSRRLAEAGAEEIDLGDTIGAGTPETVARVIREVRTALGPNAGAITLHLHDTFGRAVECVGAALDEGVRSFDGAAGGLGGCPYASVGGRRAPGNVATGTLVRAVREAGFSCAVDDARLGEAASLALALTARAGVSAGGAA